MAWDHTGGLGTSPPPCFRPVRACIQMDKFVYGFYVDHAPQERFRGRPAQEAVSYTHLRAHETGAYL
eukprot:4928269-Pyramimonas_sp.AAC.1